MAAEDLSNLPSLSVTTLSQYVRLRNCDRFLRLRLRPEEEKALLRRWDLTIQPLTPLLKESGEAFEREVEKKIAAEGYRVERVEEDDFMAIGRWLQVARGASEPVALLQVPLEARLGSYRCNGVADVVRLTPTPEGALSVRIADIKSSRKERTEHRLQVALYAYLLRQIAQETGVELDRLEGCVLHAGAGEEAPSLEEAERFDLDTYLKDVERLAIEPGSTVERVAEASFEEVSYHLGYWCDGCLYNAICMYDSAERRDLSLVPQLSATEKRMLQQHGIETLGDLASLMTLPEERPYELEPAVGQEEKAEELRQVWPLGPNLPVLVQRAKRALRRFDDSVENKSFLYNSGFGSLPDEEAYPGLVKIFIDAQSDYLEDRLYLLSALIKGPEGEETVVRFLREPPTERTERLLVVHWVRGVLQAVEQVSAAERAYLHLYLYDKLDQRALLDGLKRHLEAMAEVPGFFDLLTQSPATDQPVLSFLSKELAEHKNLGLVCTPLHDAARMLGFDWDDGTYAYYELFRARLFDNRRYVLKREDGTLASKPEDVPGSDPRAIPIESASRFNSQIPLEYAYGAWGHFEEEEDPLLRPFRRVTPEMIKGFAAHRVRALAHIEARYRPKSKYLGKGRIDLKALAGSAPDPSLARSLEEFLFMEHHAALQERLETYSLPIERRVQTGEALLLRYEGEAGGDEAHRFSIAFEAIGADPELTMKNFRPKEGSWVVLNFTDEDLSANQMKHGLLAVISELGERRLTLELRRISYGKSYHFKYWHKRGMDLEEGAYYTLDVMADDLNADKALEAIQNAESNVFYEWLQDLPPERERAEAEDTFIEEFAEHIDEVEAPWQLTGAQEEAVKATGRVFLVQGPPGTGKSYTLAWVLLGRLLERVREGKPFRVAVTCKTHKAILVALRSILRRWKRLKEKPIREVEALEFHGLFVGKLGGDPSAEAWPAGLRHVDPYREKSRLDVLMERRYLILGATPGYLYNLGKYRGEERGVDWSRRDFDFLIVDEASQMSVPEGALAGAFLKEGGSVLVVGDHRQMPPIIAHDWESEEKRSVVAAEPHLSLFEYLLARGARRISLDRSFRLNRRLAAFLEEHIYRQDGIAFYSTRSDQLAACPSSSAYVEAVLDPEYPIVFIEHDEREAQRFNELELRLVAPLVQACETHLALDGEEGLGVVVPHRAQRALLSSELSGLATHEAIDTVERFQGGERDVIIVSATASDPDFVLSEADFLLDSNRLNVAISRPRKKLVVIASRSITSLLISDLETFEQALVWKQLYHRCTREMLWEGRVKGHKVRVRGCPM